ncbi:unnamed protein product [Caenorhabditis bovis]|uniref:Uncharacterized protein n=1 Tax=Caenorhabditis bovis TaxID=2654633 RepID=A0A8S1EL48_9PELO|nr:unnamed protein product [Caenorhabditis bovis]
MCSSITQILFGVIMLGAIGLTLVSTFSKEWKTILDDTSLDELLSANITETKLQQMKSIIPVFCEDKCVNHWKDMKPYEKVVAACMIMALLLEIVAFIWNLVTSCSCCFKKYLINPLSPISFLIVLLLTTAICVFYMNSEEFAVKRHESIEHQVHNIKVDIGSAFWMAVGAWVLAIADTILASFAIFFAQHGV